MNYCEAISVTDKHQHRLQSQCEKRQNTLHDLNGRHVNFVSYYYIRTKRLPTIKKDIIYVVYDLPKSTPSKNKGLGTPHMPCNIQRTYFQFEEKIYIYIHPTLLKLIL